MRACLDSGNVQNLKKEENCCIGWTFSEKIEEYSQFKAYPDIGYSQLVTEHKTQIKRLFYILVEDELALTEV